MAGLAAVAVAIALEVFTYSATLQHEVFNPDTGVSTWNTPRWLDLLSLVVMPLFAVAVLLLLAAIVVRAVGYRRQGSRYQWPLFAAVSVTLVAGLTLYLWPTRLGAESYVNVAVAGGIASLVPALTFSRWWSRALWLLVGVPLALLGVAVSTDSATGEWLLLVGVISLGVMVLQAAFFLIGLVRGAVAVQAAHRTSGSS